MTTAREHFLWARDRAMEYIDHGDAVQAQGSIVSDLVKHPGTAAMLTPQLHLQLMRESAHGASALRLVIESIPVPDEEVTGATD